MKYKNVAIDIMNTETGEILTTLCVSADRFAEMGMPMLIEYVNLHRVTIDRMVEFREGQFEVWVTEPTKYKEVIKLERSKVWSKCVEKRWYTRGDISAYDRMLDMCTLPYSQTLLEEIAEDIVEHSDSRCWEGYDENPVLNVLFELKADCTYSTYEERAYFKKGEK